MDEAIFCFALSFSFFCSFYWLDKTGVKKQGSFSLTVTKPTTISDIIVQPGLKKWNNCFVLWYLLHLGLGSLFSFIFRKESQLLITWIQHPTDMGAKFTFLGRRGVWGGIILLELFYPQDSTLCDIMQYVPACLFYNKHWEKIYPKLMIQYL